MRRRILVQRIILPERETSPHAASGLTAARATVLVAAFSLASAVATAWVTGAFQRQTSVESAEITSAGEAAIAEIRAETDATVEEIKRLSAVSVEETKAQGSIDIEKFKLQRDLILQAIETEDRDEAQARLEFFARTGLIPDFEGGVLEFLADETAQIPSLASVERPAFPPEVQPAESRDLSNAERDFLARVGVIASGDAPTRVLCNALLLAASTAVVPTHCVGTTLDQSWVFYRDPDDRFSTPESAVSKGRVLARVLDIPSGGRAGDDGVTLFRVDGTGFEDLGPVNMRAPVVGERLTMLGRAPQKYGFAQSATTTRLRGLVIAGLDFRAVHHRNCNVLSADDHQVETTCITAVGMSGAAMFSPVDGALVTIAAWGDDEIGPTAGPILPSEGIDVSSR